MRGLSGSPAAIFFAVAVGFIVGFQLPTFVGSLFHKEMEGLQTRDPLFHYSVNSNMSFKYKKVTLRMTTKAISASHT